MGSRLSEPQLSAHLIYERLDKALFLAAVEKQCSSHWSSATGESKAAVCMTFLGC